MSDVPRTETSRTKITPNPRCARCGHDGPHFVPPSMGESGFYLCDPTPGWKMEVDKRLASLESRLGGRGEDTVGAVGGGCAPPGPRPERPRTPANEASKRGEDLPTASAADGLRERASKVAEGMVPDDSYACIADGRGGFAHAVTVTDKGCLPQWRESARRLIADALVSFARQHAEDLASDKAMLWGQLQQARIHTANAERERDEAMKAAKAAWGLLITPDAGKAAAAVPRRRVTEEEHSADGSDYPNTFDADGRRAPHEFKAALWGIAEQAGKQHWWNVQHRLLEAFRLAISENHQAINKVRERCEKGEANG